MSRQKIYVTFFHCSAIRECAALACTTIRIRIEIRAYQKRSSKWYIDNKTIFNGTKRKLLENFVSPSFRSPESWVICGVQFFYLDLQLAYPNKRKLVRNAIEFAAANCEVGRVERKDCRFLPVAELI
jgi:hypothetical protein